MASLQNQTPLSLFSGDIASLLYDDVTKAVAVSPDKSMVKWQWSTGRLADAFPIVLAGNSQRDATVKIGAEEGLRGDTEISSFLLTATSTRGLNVLPYVGSIDKNLASCPIPSNLMFGTAQMPGLLPMTLYNLPTTYWRLTLQEVSGVTNTIRPVFFGRRFLDRSRERLANERRTAFLSQFMHVYWLGPNQGFQPAITMAPGNVTPQTRTVTCTVPSSADLVCSWILDDSTSSTNLEIGENLRANIFEGQSARGLVDDPNGIPWRDFIATPTVPVIGMTGGLWRAIGTPGPAGCWTHLFKRSTDIKIQFTSVDPGTITLRFALVGLLVYAPEPLDRHLTDDTQAIAERIAQAAARGAQPVRMFGQS